MRNVAFWTLFAACVVLSAANLTFAYLNWKANRPLAIGECIQQEDGGLCRVAPHPTSGLRITNHCVKGGRAFTVAGPGSACDDGWRIACGDTAWFDLRSGMAITVCAPGATVDVEDRSRDTQTFRRIVYGDRLPLVASEAMEIDVTDAQ